LLVSAVPNTIMWGKWGGEGKGFGKGFGAGPYGKGGGLGGFGKGGGGYGASDGGWGGDDKPKKSKAHPESWGLAKVAKPENSWSGAVPGFKEALAESFQEAGVTADLDPVEELILKCEQHAQKTAKKFYNDERAKEKMTAAQCKAFIVEFVEAVMGSFSNFLYDKVWFEKISWNGALVLLVINTFTQGKIFTRVMKTEVLGFVDEGVLAWSEEEKLNKCVWKALEAGGISDSQKKKGNQHLTKAYDDAHFNAPFGTSAEGGASLTPEVTALQEFIKGWMEIFMGKAFSVFENGLEDSSPAGQVAALTAIFETLLDSDNLCLPICFQPHLPEGKWSYIEECATEVVAACNK